MPFVYLDMTPLSWPPVFVNIKMYVSKSGSECSELAVYNRIIKYRVYKRIIKYKYTIG